MDHSSSTSYRKRSIVAVVVIHGIGEQQPMSTLRGFASTLIGRRFMSKPDRVSGLDVRRLRGLKMSVCDLRLMSSLNDESDIPTEGKNLIIVAAVKNVLFIRIFDGNGKVVVDTDEKRLMEPASQIDDLRKQLESLWPPHELTRSEKDGVITAVTSIVGHTLSGDWETDLSYCQMLGMGADSGGVLHLDPVDELRA